MANSNAVATLRAGSWIANTSDALPAIAIPVNPTIFVRREIQRWLSQLRIIGPNSSLLSSFWCHFGDDRAKNQDARSTNGVLGSTGS
ncbi:MAG: hypothetical protein ACI9NT_002843, partial [Bacteroidia bacterium]